LTFATFELPSTLLGQEAYSSEHPEVKAMVEKAVNFMSSGKMFRTYSAPEYDILVGYAIYKGTEDHDHPKVVEAALVAQKLLRQLANPKSPEYQGAHLLYQICMSAIFLSALDGEKYKAELEQCRDMLSAVQKPSGGFGYVYTHEGSRGDTSQTQYVTLALWSMKQAKIEVDMRVVEKVCVWLQREQQPNGGWTYQATGNTNNSGGGNQNSGTTPTMHAAGLSAVLIAGDILDVMRGNGAKIANSLPDEEEEEAEIPIVFRRVSAEEAAGKKEKKFVTKAVSREMLKKVAQNAAKWSAENPFKRSGRGDWYYYKIYSQERYESFLEILEGRRQKDPQWYREGVEQLKKFQDPVTGGFGITSESEDVGGVEVATSLSVLFLLRTTQKAIGDLKEAVSTGGQGLGNVSDVANVDGKVVDKSKITSVDDMLKMLESNKAGSPDDKLLADRIPLEVDPKARKEQLNRFSRMLRSPSYASRRLSAKILGRGDDLDYVPDLIYALSDPDEGVPLIAENSLRILSRQMTSAALPKDKVLTQDDRVKAERRWQQWYLSVRPDHRFISN